MAGLPLQSGFGHRGVGGLVVGHDDNLGTLAADGTVTGQWFVVAGSGTGQLAGLSGAGGFTPRLGEHAEAWLDYVLA